MQVRRTILTLNYCTVLNTVPRQVDPDGEVQPYSLDTAFAAQIVRTVRDVTFWVIFRHCCTTVSVLVAFSYA